MWHSLLNGRVARLAVLGAAFITLSGLPAYAESGQYYQQGNYGYGPGYGNGACQDGPRSWNGGRCQDASRYRNHGRYQRWNGYGGDPRDQYRYQDRGWYRQPQDRQPGRLPYQRQWCQGWNWNNCQQPLPQQNNDYQHTHDDGNSK